MCSGLEKATVVRPYVQNLVTARRHHFTAIPLMDGEALTKTHPLAEAVTIDS